MLALRTKTACRHRFFLALAVLTWPAADATLLAQTATPRAGAAAPAQQWAVLVGVEKYHRAHHLRHTVNDVKQIVRALRDHADYPAENILEIVDTQLNPRLQPLKTSMETELSAWLKKPGPDDQLIVFFSGHGFRDEEGKLYLAPIDCNPAAAKATGIPVEWLRDKLAACRAKFKLLVIDACHAGSDKGEDESDRVTAKELGEPFRDLTGVFTLASSTAEEKSQIWPDMEQSLFSYWFVQALKGHADNGDARLTVDELYEYVHRNVTETASLHFPRPQTPVRIARDTPGVPVVVRLRPRDSLDHLLSDMAERLARDVKLRNLPKVGVLEFTTDTGLAEALGADFGLLGRHCAVELERHLIDHSLSKFSVINRRVLQAALSKQQFALKDLGSPRALEELSEAAGGMPVLAVGTLRSRTGRVVTLQCDLVQTNSDDLAGAAGGSASLTDSQWAMLGRSVQVKPEYRKPELPQPGVAARPVNETLIERVEEASAGPHPMLAPEFPFPVSVHVKSPGAERPVACPPVYRGNDLFVALKQGDVYEIHVENRSGVKVLMRLLVDGLNTLPEKVRAKGVTVEAVTHLPAQPVSLDEARHWILDPQAARNFAVRGFVTETGESGSLRRFEVVDAQESLGPRQAFTDQIGIITAAFYAPKSTSRNWPNGTGNSPPLRTKMGEEQGERLTEGEKTECGNLLAVVHIRYVDPATLHRVLSE